MRTTLLYGVMFLLWTVTQVAPLKAQTRIYPDKEIYCVANALYLEAGSIKATDEELRVMAHTMKVRAETTNLWYQFVDWGGPNLCEVVHWKIGGVCQYSAYCKDTSELRHFRDPSRIIREAIIQYPPMSYFPGALMPGKVTYDELWLRSWNAAYAVFGEPKEKRYEPPGDLRFADTYQHWCSDPKYHKESCNKKLVSSPRSKCWFALALKENETQLEGPHILHKFYTTLTPSETYDALSSPPPTVCALMGDEAEEYVKRVRTDQLYRLLNPNPEVRKAGAGSNEPITLTKKKSEKKKASRAKKQRDKAKKSAGEKEKKKKTKTRKRR